MSETPLDISANEIRNTLTVIKGRAQRLRRRVLASGHPDRTLLRELDEIDRSVDRLVRLIDHRLAIASPNEPPDPNATPG